MRRAVLLTATLALGVLIALPATADRDPGVHALVDARIIPAPGQVIESGTLVLRHGIIEAVGADVTPPDDARVWDLEGASLYPGLIESFYPMELPEADKDAASPVAHENALVGPEREMIRHVDASAFSKLRQAGFTTAVFVPRDGLFRGQSVTVNLGDAPVGEQILVPGTAQNAQFTLNDDGGYPNSLMGAIALFRQTLLDARWHRAAHDAYGRNPRQARPVYNAAWHALEGVAHGSAPIVLQSRNPNDAMRWLKLVDEFDLDAILVGSGKEYRRADLLTTGEQPWIVPVKYPKAPNVDPDHPEQVDLDKLRHWDRAPDNLGVLLNAGAQVAVTALGLSDAKDVLKNLGRSIERGLDADQALASLTTVPAALWGIDDRAGTLEPGKMANIVITDGDLFTDSPKLRALWIDGRYLELKEIKPPEVDPLGTWDIVIDAGDGGMIPVTVTLSGTVEALTGSAQAMGIDLPFLDATVSGSAVELSVNSAPIGIPGTTSLTLNIDGDNCTGDGITPQGPFTLSGNRTSRPDSEVIR